MTLKIVGCVSRKIRFSDFENLMGYRMLRFRAYNIGSYIVFIVFGPKAPNSDAYFCCSWVRVISQIVRISSKYADWHGFELEREINLSNVLSLPRR